MYDTSPTMIPLRRIDSEIIHFGRAARQLDSAFTTVIPLIIIGFDYLSGFAENASPGTLFIRELGLVSP